MARGRAPGAAGRRRRRARLGVRGGRRPLRRGRGGHYQTARRHRRKPRCAGTAGLAGGSAQGATRPGRLLGRRAAQLRRRPGRRELAGVAAARRQRALQPVRMALQAAGVPARGRLPVLPRVPAGRAQEAQEGQGRGAAPGPASALGCRRWSAAVSIACSSEAACRLSGILRVGNEFAGRSVWKALKGGRHVLRGDLSARGRAALLNLEPFPERMTWGA
mmetsp:Transcript_91056/g.237207  ORF Transcript_91056/g.237207 Transcript_91056/m.237207 type:complete len:219 (-) Transcript_91056:37-693(-)